MKILSIEVSGTELNTVLLTGTKISYQVESLGKMLKVSNSKPSVKDVIDLQKNFGMKLDEIKPDIVSIVEGGNDAKKNRIQIEFVIQAMCLERNITVNTYPSGSCTKFINTGFQKKTNKPFLSEFEKFSIPKYMTKVFALAWKCLND